MSRARRRRENGCGVGGSSDGGTAARRYTGPHEEAPVRAPAALPRDAHARELRLGGRRRAPAAGAGRGQDGGVGAITDVPGIRVGHWSDEHALTGCTVVLFDGEATAGVSVRGGSPGTRETDLLDPLKVNERIDAICLAGGSAFGLAAADGVMRWLEERGRGRKVANAVVPIVPAAIVFDLSVGDPSVRPGPPQGYAACEAASGEAPREGAVGAGTGATVAKLMGREHARRGGIGTAARRV
ncbi:MAG: P1 family peptidase, partial [Chloroflexota bacterium]|nr:P1 family peptidase [Chloroflexota bacterium]